MQRYLLQDRVYYLDTITILFSESSLSTHIHVNYVQANIFFSRLLILILQIQYYLFK